MFCCYAVHCHGASTAVLPLLLTADCDEESLRVRDRGAESQATSYSSYAAVWWQQQFLGFEG